jgi:hypothetical protein
MAGLCLGGETPCLTGLMRADSGRVRKKRLPAFYWAVDAQKKRGAIAPRKRWFVFTSKGVLPLQIYGQRGDNP